VIETDAVIIGAGPSGCATAMELLAAGRRVLVVGASGDCAGLETLSAYAGAWLARHNVPLGDPIPTVVAWWGSDQPVRTEAPGALVVSRQVLRDSLQQQVLAGGGLRLPGAVLLDVKRAGQRWTIRLLDSDGVLDLASEFLVDATGRASAVARRLGARRVHSDYLVSASIEVSGPGASGVWTESVSDGWWNLVATAEKSTLSFFTRPSTMRSTAGHLKRVFSAVRHLKGLASIPAGLLKPELRPAGSSYASASCGEGWVCVGDAVSAFQPLSSAGIAKAFHDAKLTRAILGGHERGYTATKVKEFEDYRRQLRNQYRLETRWATAFWQVQS